jgi:hypothetical protein
MACKDPQLTYLNGLGYNVVRLPRKGIEPLDVLGIDGSSRERLGRMNDIWTSSAGVPQLNPPQAASNINGQKSQSLDLAIGLTLLSGILGGMGATTPQLNFAYNKARKVSFTFSNVQSESVDPFSVGKFLSSGSLDINNPFVDRYFGNEETEAYIITEVLKSDRVTVTGQDNSGASIGVDLPSIQSAVGAKVSVSSSSAANTDLTYQGEDALTFGFKVFRVDYESGRWVVRGVKPSSDVSFAATAAVGGIVEVPPFDGDPVLLREGGLVAIR